MDVGLALSTGSLPGLAPGTDSRHRLCEQRGFRCWAQASCRLTPPQSSRMCSKVSPGHAPRSLC